MSDLTYDTEIPALLVIDPYNDVIVTTRELVESISPLSALRAPDR